MLLKSFAIALCLLGASHASAQVRCQMPNGVVIEQRLSDRCPQGAVKAETLDGAPAETRALSLAGPSKIVTSADGRRFQAVSGAEFGADWPLTVEDGELSCSPLDVGGQALPAALFSNGGKVYALNGIAKSRAGSGGWQDVAAIWRDSVTVAGTKVPLGPLIERALLLCAQPATEKVAKPSAKPVGAAVPVARTEVGMSATAWVLVVLLVAGLVAGIKAAASGSGPRQYCTSCGHEGQARTRTKGSLLIEIILWLSFLLPGVIYTIWRHISRERVCSACGSSTLIPPDSPAALDMKRRLRAS